MAPIVTVEHLSKKYSRNAHAHLGYGLGDLFREVMGKKRSEDLRKDEFLAVKDVSFELNAGDSLALIGRNGSGKTTILKMLTGLVKPDAGEITVRGRVQALINLGAGFSPNLPGRDNVYNSASLMGLGHRETTELLDEIIDFAELGEFIDSPVGTYSSGMTARLGFAVAVHLKPDVLLIDEVLAVGDFAFQNKCFTRMEQLKKEGVTIIFVSHSQSAVVKLCQRAAWIHGGRIMELGPALDTVQAYLGFLENEEQERAKRESERRAGTGRRRDKQTKGGAGAEARREPEPSAPQPKDEMDLKVAVSEPKVREQEIVLNTSQEEFTINGWYKASTEKPMAVTVNGAPIEVQFAKRADVEALYPDAGVVKGYSAVITRDMLEPSNEVQVIVGGIVHWSKTILVEGLGEEPKSAPRDSIYGALHPASDDVDSVECRLFVDGEEVDVLPIHSEVVIRFSFRLKREVQGLCSTLNFHRKDGLRVAAIATLTDGRLEHIHCGHVHCEVRIPDFDFVPGPYVIVMPISEGQSYLWRDIVKEFHVDGGGRLYWGIKEINHSYEVRVE